MSVPSFSLNATEKTYPLLLKHFDGHPVNLNGAGNTLALEGPFISIVGSRQMSAYGQKIVRLLIPALVRSGLTIVSGLAYGIDAFVHQIALREGGMCVAVLGSGLKAIYPSVNRPLAAEITKQGCLLSEYEDDVGPQQRYFPERNRIVAGMSPLTLIIEAGAKSGTLITARMALNAGREVCVVPGDVTSPLTAGIHILLGEGAKAVRSAKEILDLYGFPEIEASPLTCLTDEERELYALIPAGGVEIETLLVASHLSFPFLQAHLSALELKNAVYFHSHLWHKT